MNPPLFCAAFLCGEFAKHGYLSGCATFVTPKVWPSVTEHFPKLYKTFVPRRFVSDVAAIWQDLLNYMHEHDEESDSIEGRGHTAGCRSKLS